jgi:hypothetical protein
VFELVDGAERELNIALGIDVVESLPGDFAEVVDVHVVVHHHDTLGKHRAGQANDSGVLFRYSDGTWIYNLSTTGLAPGTYTLTLEMPDGQRYNAGFVLR